MTSAERAQYLIQQLGHVKAEEHALWVANEAVKSVTRQYWYEVVAEIRKSPNPLPKHDTHKCGDGHYPGLPFTP